MDIGSIFINGCGKESPSVGTFFKGLSLYSFRKCLIGKNDELRSRINIGAAYCLMGKYGKAELFLTDAYMRKHGDVTTLLWLIETGLRSENNKAVNRNADKLLARMKLNELIALAEKLSANKASEDGFLNPLLQKKIATVLSEKIRGKFSGIK